MLRQAVAVLPTAVPPPPVAAALLIVAHQAHPAAVHPVRPTAVVDILSEEDKLETRDLRLETKIVNKNRKS